MNEQDIADSFGVSPELLPFLPELLADIWVLGSWPEHIVEALRELDLPNDATRVLEVGCGKGAVCVPIARDLGFRVHGVDLFEPFLQEARTRAAEAGVADRCTFEQADMKEVLGRGETYDVVVIAAVGHALGDTVETVGALRQAVRPGGYMVLDDGYLSRKERVDYPGYEHCRDRETTLRELTAHGDRLVKEEVIPFTDLMAYNARNNEVIARRVTEVSLRHPELREQLLRYQQAEIEECLLLETETVAAILLLQRT